MVDFQKNCISYWFPKLKDAGLLVPQTEIFHTDLPLLGLEDGSCPAPTELCHSILKAGDRLGWPVFLRTGQGSGKHDWDHCCFLRRGTDIPDHVRNLVVWSNTVDFMGLPTDVWAVREFLPTFKWITLPRYGNMPLCREHRFFVKDSEVLYHQPYWPEGAIREGLDPEVHQIINFDVLMKIMNEPPDEKINNVASNAGQAVGGEWSVDIFETKKGYYITDMAIASMSYGYNAERFGAEEKEFQNGEEA